MKITQLPDHDSRVQEQLESWSLSWNPDGRCDSFTKAAILAYAPPVSGVYGLFNFDYQIFIGEAANIRDVLLRLESEADFQPQHLRPTGFTFEPCSEESRKLKAAELIARYHPALQMMAASNEPGLPPNAPMKTDYGKAAVPAETHVDDLEFPGHGETPPKNHRPFQFMRAQYIALAVVLSASAVAFPVFMSLDNAQSRKNGASETLSAAATIPRSSGVDQAGQRSAPPRVSSINAARERAKSDEDPTPGKPSGAVHLAKASGADESDVQRLLASAKPNPTNDKREKKWSVQISAAPAKHLADNLAQELIAKGYDSYVVPAEVKGQAYYRVRAGHFDARDEAESMRQALARQEGYRDAYVTAD